MPKDFAIEGKEETLKVEVQYDTLELYGKLNASRTIKVCRE